MIKKKRVEYIDIAKGIAFFFVVLGHLPIKHDTFNWIFSFHMPLFFILSGMTLDISKYDNIIPFIKKKAKQLVLPYIVISFILLGTNLYVGMHQNGRVNICDCLYGAYINYFLASVTGSLLILLISYRIKSNKVLGFYGRNTLIMFIAHGLLIDLTLYLVSLLNLKFEINQLIIAVVICIELLPITYLYNSIMEYIYKYKIVKVSN